MSWESFVVHGAGVTASAPWTTLSALAARQAAHMPDRLAATFYESGQSLTYAELVQRADATAAGLHQLGAGRGDRVATVLANCPEALITWLACARIGAVYCPLNNALGDADLRHVIAEIDPTVLLVEAGAPGQVDWRSLAPAAQLVTLCPASPDPSTSGGGGDTGAVGFASLAQTGTTPPDVAVDPADPAVLILTGGTTGLPKAVIRNHFSLMCSAVRYAAMLEVAPSDRQLVNGQLFHSAAQECGFIGPLMAGIPSYWTAKFSVRSFWDRAISSGATLTDLNGAVLNFLLAQDLSAHDHSHSLTRAICATHGVTAKARAQFQARFGIPHLLEIFAMSETGMLLFCNTPSSTRDGSVGHSRGWCEVRIADERGFPLATGEVGEILLRPTLPASTTSGYFRRPEATVTLLRDGWLHTQDLGRVDADGWLYFADRQVNRVRRRGENISVTEVEQILDSHPQVLESAVVGVPSEFGDQDLKAVVVALPGPDLRPTTLIDWCVARLASFKVPRYIVITDEPLPRAATKQQIERHQVRDIGRGREWDRDADRLTA